MIVSPGAKLCAGIVAAVLTLAIIGVVKSFRTSREWRTRVGEAMVELRAANEVNRTNGARIQVLEAANEESASQVREEQSRAQALLADTERLTRDIERLSERVKREQHKATDFSTQTAHFKVIVRSLTEEIWAAKKEWREARVVNAFAKAAEVVAANKSKGTEQVLMYLATPLEANQAYDDAQRAAGAAAALMLREDTLDISAAAQALKLQGRALYNAGRFDEAIEVLERAAIECRRAEGSRLDDLREVLGLHVDCLLNLDREVEAATVMRQLYDLALAKAGKNPQERARRDLATLLVLQGRLDEAEQLWRELLTGLLEAHREEDHICFDARCGLAWVLFLRGEQSELELLHQDLTSYAEFAEAIQAPSVSLTYAQYLIARGDLNRAERSLLIGYRRRLIRHGASGNAWLKPLIAVYEQLGESAKADIYRARLVRPISRISEVK